MRKHTQLIVRDNSQRASHQSMGKQVPCEKLTAVIWTHKKEIIDRFYAIPDQCDSVRGKTKMKTKVIIHGCNWRTHEWDGGWE